MKRDMTFDMKRMLKKKLQAEYKTEINLELGRGT